MALSPASAELVHLGEASSSLQGSSRTSFGPSFNHPRCRLIANCIVYSSAFFPRQRNPVSDQTRLSVRKSCLSLSGATRKLTEANGGGFYTPYRHMRTRRASLTTSRSGYARGAVCLVSRAGSAIRRRARSHVSHVVNERFGMLPWRRVDWQKINQTAGEM